MTLKEVVHVFQYWRFAFQKPHKARYHVGMTDTIIDFAFYNALLGMDFCDRIYLTQIHLTVDGDRYFPELSPDQWHKVSSEFHEAGAHDDADYTIDSGVILMTGNVLLTQGQNALTSQKMTINLIDGTANMAGRVKTILKTAKD